MARGINKGNLDWVTQAMMPKCVLCHLEHGCKREHSDINKFGVTSKSRTNARSAPSGQQSQRSFMIACNNLPTGSNCGDFIKKGFKKFNQWSARCVLVKWKKMVSNATLQKSLLTFECNCLMARGDGGNAASKAIRFQRWGGLWQMRHNKRHLSKVVTDKLRPLNHSKHRKALTSRKVALWSSLPQQAPAPQQAAPQSFGSWVMLLNKRLLKAAPTTTSSSAAPLRSRAPKDQKHSEPETSASAKTLNDFETMNIPFWILT